jgi:TetR/AcrR family transcriptional repressor of lmrAB and yxaGH operons
MTQSKPRLHRRNLIRAAIRLFRRRGYAATGLTEILSASGAPKGSLYYYFPGGKEELAAASVSAAARTVTATLEEIAKTTDSAGEFVDRYCDNLAYWVSRSNFAEGCPISTVLLETAAQSPSIARVGQDGFAAWEGILTHIFERDGWESVAARQHGALVLSAIQGALLLSRVTRSTNPFQNVKRLPRLIGQSLRL